MTNTQKFYNLMKRHSEFLAELTAEYNEALKRMEPYKGSEGYDRAMEELETVKREELAEARKTANDELEKILGDMESTWNSKGLEAPSEEQVRLLSVLSQMKTIHKDVFKQAMNTMGGNRLGELRLAEIAHDHGELMPLARQMTSVQVRESINGLRRGADHFINRAHSLDDAVRRGYVNGTNGDPTKTDSLLWRMTGPEATASMENALRIFGCITDSASFCAAVDGGAE